MIRGFCALVVLLVTSSAVAQTTIHNDDSCDIGLAPAATLLLPYFDVDFKAPPESARTTLFSVTNVTHRPQIARVTLWTDWAYPVLTFNLFLTGYDAQSINLYDVIANGRMAQTSNAGSRGPFSAQDDIGNVNFLPTARANCAPSAMPAALPPGVLRELQSALTTGLFSPCGMPRIGGAHSSAVGYATIDLVADCTFTLPIESRYHTNDLLFENVLIGDYQSVASHRAHGEPLVHIRAVPEGGKAGSLAETNLPYTFYDRYTPSAHRGVDRRQPLPSAFAARHIEGGATGFRTSLLIWREGVTGAGAECSSYLNNRAIEAAERVRFDERENPTTIPPLFIPCTCFYTSLATPATIRIATSNSLFPPLTSGDVGGWMYLNLHTPKVTGATSARATQNWVVVEMEAEGRYAAGFSAAWLGNGCSPPAGISTHTGTNAIGPRP